MPAKPTPRRIWVVRWESPDGTRVPAGTPGAKKRRERSDTYYAYVGRKRVALNTADLGEAWERLRAVLRARGQPAQAGALYDAAPLAQLLDEWLAVLASNGSSEEHCRKVKARLTLLLDKAGWRTPADVTDDGLALALAEVARVTPGKGRKPRPMAPATRNHYRGHAVAFCAWLSRKLGRPLLAEKPRKLPVETDRRHPRRCPTRDEVSALFAHLEQPDCPARGGMAAPHRRLLYLVAMGTGLRASEIRSLSWDSFALGGEAPAGTVDGAYSKHQRRDTLQLPPWLTAELAAHRAAGGPLWPDLPPCPALVLQDDLAAAGVPYRTAEGFFDFHALRVYYVTQLANQPDITPKTLLELTRLSTPALALAVYARAKQDAAKTAVDKLPPPGQ